MTLEDDVKKVRSLLSNELHFFPANCCKIAVIAMFEKGYAIIGGEILLDNYDSNGMQKSIPHYWSYDSKSEKNFDITASQFNAYSSYNFPAVLFFRTGEMLMYKPIKTNLEPHNIF